MNSLTRRVSLLGLGLAAMLTVGGPAMAAPLEAKLRFSLAPKPAANKVQLVFTLQNESDEAIQVLKWRTPLEGVLGPIFEVQCDGKNLKYRGPMIKRGAPTDIDFVTIAGKGSAAATIDLSQSYDFPAAGSCQVQFNGTVLEVRGSGANTRGEILHNVRAEGDPVTFRLS